jgi:hypothetical protein
MLKMMAVNTSWQGYIIGLIVLLWVILAGSFCVLMVLNG